MRSSLRRIRPLLILLVSAALGVGSLVGLGGWVTTRFAAAKPWQLVPTAAAAAGDDTTTAVAPDAAAAPAGRAATPIPAFTFGPDTIADMVERVRGAVVRIETFAEVSVRTLDPFADDPFFRDFFGYTPPTPRNRQRRTGLGSGVIVSADGHIVTNNHVIQGAEKIEVTVEGHEKQYQATVVGRDARTDLAVLKIDAAKPLTYAVLGDSSRVRVGEWVVAIGNPYGYDHTVTTGVISATGRPIETPNRTFDDLLQTDAAINPGNSGGPLLNLAGEVIGINTMIETPSGGNVGIGFAISANTVKDIYHQIRESGRVARPVQAYMGIYMQDVDDRIARALGLAAARGVVIAAVAEGSPAEEAGLRRYDVILEFDQQAVGDSAELKRLVQGQEPGSSVLLLVWRNGEPVTVAVTLGQAPAQDS